MKTAINLVTLGVRDVAAATAFYERLGFEKSVASQSAVSFLRAGSITLSLFGRSDLAADAGVVSDAPSVFSGVTLAINVSSKEEVDITMRTAADVGARITQPASEVFWGGYRGYFSDPDGYLWEVAWNPFFPLDAAGNVVLP